MNEKQKRFADYYIENPNATEAAKKAGYSEKTAEVQGSRLLTNVKVKDYVKERLESKDKERIASQNEVLEFFTQVMRGEVPDQLGLETPVKERNKAAEMLGRRYKIFDDNNLNIKVVMFGGEDKLED